MPYVRGFLDVVEASPGEPAHPIAPGGEPPGIWPSPGYPAHPIEPAPPGIWPSPGRPGHPIAPGGRPPGIWGGPPLYPDQGLPPPPPGIWPGPHPSHPIQPVPPDSGLEPGEIWPPVAPDGVQGLFLVVAWVPEYGWRYVVVDPSLKPDQGLPPTEGGETPPPGEVTPHGRRAKT